MCQLALACELKKHDAVSVTDPRHGFEGTYFIDGDLEDLFLSRPLEKQWKMFCFVFFVLQR